MNSFPLVIRLVSILDPIIRGLYYCKFFNYNTLKKSLSGFILSW